MQLKTQKASFKDYIANPTCSAFTQETETDTQTIQINTRMQKWEMISSAPHSLAVQPSQAVPLCGKTQPAKDITKL